MANPYARIPWNPLAALLSVQRLSICHLQDQDFAIVDSGGRGLGTVGELKWHQLDDVFRKTGSLPEATRMLLKVACGEEVALKLAPGLYAKPAPKEKVGRKAGPDTQALLAKLREASAPK